MRLYGGPRHSRPELVDRAMLNDLRSISAFDPEFLGVELDRQGNAEGGEKIFTDASRVAGRVIRTDEELMIAKKVCRFLKAEVQCKLTLRYMSAP